MTLLIIGHTLYVANIVIKMKKVIIAAIFAFGMASCTPTPPEPPKEFPKEKLRNWNDWVDNEGKVDTANFN